MIAALLLRLARSSIGALLIGWAFAHASFALPLRRLRETNSLVAFHHPQPSCPVHILIMPKKALRSLADLTPDDAPLLLEVFQAAHGLAVEFNLEQSGYRLIVNGGAYQEVKQLHFHLVSG